MEFFLITCAVMAAVIAVVHKASEYLGFAMKWRPLALCAVMAVAANLITLLVSSYITFDYVALIVILIIASAALMTYYNEYLLKHDLEWEPEKTTLEKVEAKLDSVAAGDKAQPSQDEEPESLEPPTVETIWEAETKAETAVPEALPADIPAPDLTPVAAPSPEPIVSVPPVPEPIVNFEPVPEPEPVFEPEPEAVFAPEPVFEGSPEPVTEPESIIEQPPEVAYEPEPEEFIFEPEPTPGLGPEIISKPKPEETVPEPEETVPEPETVSAPEPEETVSVSEPETVAQPTPEPNRGAFVMGPNGFSFVSPEEQEALSGQAAASEAAIERSPEFVPQPEPVSEPEPEPVPPPDISEEKLAALSTLDDFLDYAYSEKGEGNLATAAAVLATAVEKFGDNSYAPFIVIELANVYKAQGDYQAAIRAYRDACNLPAVAGDELTAAQFRSSEEYLIKLMAVLEKHGTPQLSFTEIPEDYFREII